MQKQPRGFLLSTHTQELSSPCILAVPVPVLRDALPVPGLGHSFKAEGESEAAFTSQRAVRSTGVGDDLGSVSLGGFGLCLCIARGLRCARPGFGQSVTPRAGTGAVGGGCW